MNIADFITELYCTIDDALPDDAPQHPQAVLSLGERVLQARRRSSYGVELWPNCPNAPGSTARNSILLGRAAGHQVGRKGQIRSGRDRSEGQIQSLGGKLCIVLNQWGRIVAWDCNTAASP